MHSIVQISEYATLLHVHNWIHVFELDCLQTSTLDIHHTTYIIIIDWRGDNMALAGIFYENHLEPFNDWITWFVAQTILQLFNLYWYFIELFSRTTFYWICPEFKRRKKNAQLGLKTDDKNRIHQSVNGIYTNFRSCGCILNIFQIHIQIDKHWTVRQWERGLERTRNIDTLNRII